MNSQDIESVPGDFKARNQRFYEDPHHQFAFLCQDCSDGIEETMYYNSVAEPEEEVQPEGWIKF